VFVLGVGRIDNKSRQPAASATLAAGWRERASFRC
jgi:hypothetical protein